MKIEQRKITSLENNNTYLDMRKQDIRCMIDGEWNLTNQKPEDTIIQLEGMQEFYLLKGADFVLFFNDKDERQEVIKLLENNFEPKGNIWSVEKEEGVQSPKVIGSFEYNGKIGLWIDAKNPLNDITSNEKGIYRGVIVNPIAYYKGIEETKQITNETNNQAKKVLLYLKNSKTKDSYK